MPKITDWSVRFVRYFLRVLVNVRTRRCRVGHSIVPAHGGASTTVYRTEDDAPLGMSSSDDFSPKPGRGNAIKWRLGEDLIEICPETPRSELIARHSPRCRENRPGNSSEGVGNLKCYIPVLQEI